MRRAPHRDGRDAVRERPLGREVGRQRADDLPERALAVERERRALVAHDLGAGRRHDRALSPPRRRTARGGAGRARGGRRPRRARAARRRARRRRRSRPCARATLAREASAGPAATSLTRCALVSVIPRPLLRRSPRWTLSIGTHPMAERRRARFCVRCHRVSNARRPSTAPPSRRASRATQCDLRARPRRRGRRHAGDRLRARHRGAVGDRDAAAPRCARPRRVPPRQRRAADALGHPRRATPGAPPGRDRDASSRRRSASPPRRRPKRRARSSTISATAWSRASARSSARRPAPGAGASARCPSPNSHNAPRRRVRHRSGSDLSSGTTRRLGLGSNFCPRRPVPEPRRSYQILL